MLTRFSVAWALSHPVKPWVVALVPQGAGAGQKAGEVRATAFRVETQKPASSQWPDVLAHFLSPGGR